MYVVLEIIKMFAIKKFLFFHKVIGMPWYVIYIPAGT